MQSSGTPSHIKALATQKIKVLRLRWSAAPDSPKGAPGFCLANVVLRSNDSKLSRQVSHDHQKDDATDRIQNVFKSRGHYPQSLRRIRLFPAASRIFSPASRSQRGNSKYH